MWLVSVCVNFEMPAYEASLSENGVILRLGTQQSNSKKSETSNHNLLKLTHHF